MNRFGLNQFLKSSLKLSLKSLQSIYQSTSKSFAFSFNKMLRPNVTKWYWTFVYLQLNDSIEKSWMLCLSVNSNMVTARWEIITKMSNTRQLFCQQFVVFHVRRWVCKLNSNLVIWSHVNESIISVLRYVRFYIERGKEKEEEEDGSRQHTYR